MCLVIVIVYIKYILVDVRINFSIGEGSRYEVLFLDKELMVMIIDEKKRERVGFFL